jgi:hypothetical protein
VNGKAVGLTAVGAVVAYSGIRGKGLSSAFRNVLEGQSPRNAVSANPIIGQDVATLTGGGTGILTGPNAAIGQRAMQDVGHPYLYGGWFTNPNGWDCSSATNWWLSRFAITLPGGIKNYQGNWHGPVVGNYQLWTGARSVSRSQVQSGDLVLFGASHMGIATSNAEFVSAQNPANGTRISSIDGFGGTPNFRRIVGASTGIGG